MHDVACEFACAVRIVHGPGPWKEPFGTKNTKHSFLTTLIPLGYFGV